MTPSQGLQDTRNPRTSAHTVDSATTFSLADQYKDIPRHLLAGNVPPKANLGDLRGLSAGLAAGGSVMIDGGDFDGAKAYKDSKVSAYVPCF